jgi:Apea-like HEPN
MRVMMPLFNFQYFDEADFAFSDGRFSIRRFVAAQHAIEQDIFSKRDRYYMGQQAHKALVAESPNLIGYESDVSLLLMAFRLLSDHRTPIIKYKLSDDDNLCGRIEETEMHILLPGYRYEVYSVQDFPRIDGVYMMFRNAERTSVRLKNAFFFVYRAFNSFHWIDAFLFHMTALEAIFSKDSKGGATKTICQRVSALLNDPATWNDQVIADLYDVRSRITHGNIEASHDPSDNLRLLEKMELLTKLCFRKLISLDAFESFMTTSSRDQFMEQLDKLHS